MKYFDQSNSPEAPYAWMAEDDSSFSSGSVLPWIAGEAERYSERPLANSYARLIESNSLASLISGETFFDHLSESGRNARGVVCKLISLILVPGFFAVGAYLFFAGYLGWWEFPSKVVSLLTLILIGYQASQRLPKRPSFLDVLKFMVEEVEVFWVMWMVGSMTFSFLYHHVGIFSLASTGLGLLTAVLSYLLVASHIRGQPAAETIIGYLLQFARVVVTSVVVVVAGFLLTPLVWTRAAWPYDHYTGAMFCSLLWFWVAINVFYVSDDENGSPERLERGSAIELN